jgi:hypothetical protein
VLGPKDSDCGSIRTISVKITPSTKKRYLYRYIKEGSKLICLTPDVIDKYVGKVVRMRSPMCCIGVGKQKNLCNMCAGDFYYKLDKKNIGLVTCTISGTISNLNLQKFHDNTVHTKLIDVDHLLI